MKRIFVLLLTVVMTVLNSVAAFSNDKPILSGLSASYDNDTKEVTVNGKIANPAANQEMTLMVFPKGADRNNSENIYYIDQLPANIQGDNDISFSFKLKDGAVKGQYTLRMGGTDVEMALDTDFVYDTSRTSKGIKITFNKPVSGLGLEHIKVVGATAYDLVKEGDGSEWLLYIRDITVPDESNVTITIENFVNFVIDGQKSQDVKVYVGE